MRVLVTGAAGLIGRYTVAELRKLGHEALPVDLTEPHTAELTAPVTGLVAGDVTEPGFLDTVCREFRPEALVHLAYRLDIDGVEPLIGVQTNVYGFAATLDAAVRNGLNRVVWTSSVMVYGEADRYGDRPVTEEGPLAPCTFYGECKRFDEFLASHYRRRYGLDVVTVRPTTVYGPERRRGGAAAYLFDLVLGAARGLPVSVTEGSRATDLVHVRDVAAGIVRVLEAKRLTLNAYNLSGWRASVADVARWVSQWAPGVPLTIHPGGRDLWPSKVDRRAAMRDFGYLPRITPEAGMAELFRAVQAETEPKGDSR